MLTVSLILLINLDGTLKLIVFSHKLEILLGLFQVWLFPKIPIIEDVVWPKSVIPVLLSNDLLLKQSQKLKISKSMIWLFFNISAASMKKLACSIIFLFTNRAPTCNTRWQVFLWGKWMIVKILWNKTGGYFAFSFCFLCIGGGL